ncbi:cellulose binding domain-containing protein [Streptomyces boninensis]|uniref:cellulose binding domain-containing protein n=1 Tax=Streptomyces boninensis TaxID=2039455 RepID=UPI003B217C3D
MRRRRFLGLAAATAATAATPILARPSLATAAPATDARAAPVWRGVAVGGGGFVPGILFSQSRKGLVYARTDIGGAYRWDAAGAAWIPLLDWVGLGNWGYNGVVSLAIDESAPDRLYAAVGMYTNSWDPNNGAVLRSGDRGDTWQTSPLPFKLGGNMPGRGMGERLAVDPNKGSVLYLGAPSGHGLWRSTDAGATWSKVASFPNPGNYVADPNDSSGYQSDIQGVVWVLFDKRSGSAGTASRTIYVGVADKDNTVYRSTDAGATWSRIAGQPAGYLAHKGVFDHVGGRLYIATSDTGGPYDGAKGDVWRYDTADSAWTRISPVPSTSSDNTFGYSGLAIDRQHPDTIMVATQIAWWPDITIFRSTDAGATWTRIWDWGAYPERTFRYTQDISSVPWLTFGSSPQLPEITPKLGWMTEALEIDPFDSDRMLYGTGATIYAATDLTKWDSGGKITIKPIVAGLEETAVLDLISPPSGPQLLSALGDIGGFVHTDLTKIPALMYTQPNYTSTTSLDYAELKPAVIARCGNIDKSANPGVNRAAFSTDGGAHWSQASGEPGGVSGGGTIAVSADGSVAVWAPEGAAVSRTTVSGGSWTACSGVPQGAMVRADRAAAARFYAYAGGKIYASRDGGASFTATAASGLPASGAVLKAVPGAEGELWLAGEGGLWHSTDGGTSFTKASGVTTSLNIGFGKPASGSRPALYLIGTAGGTAGIHASDDNGATWRRINDDRHQYGNIGACITGDPRLYGRVYVGTNGRGIVYADASGNDPGGPTGAVKVRYKNNDSSATDNQIKPGLQLVNTGTTAVDLSKVKLRYYFTGDAGSATYQTWCDYAALGAANVTRRTAALSPARPGADRYLEAGFTAGAGSLAPGANTGEIQLRLNKSDWSAFSEADDYSRAASTAFTDAPKVTAYVNGVLAWGTEP